MSERFFSTSVENLFGNTNKCKYQEESRITVLSLNTGSDMKKVSLLGTITTVSGCPHLFIGQDNQCRGMCGAGEPHGW